MISVGLAIFLLAVHWFADFYCQTDDMALGKSTSLVWLSLHVAVYTTVLTFFLVGSTLSCRYLPYYDAAPDYELRKASIAAVALYALSNGVIHFVVDYFTSRWTARLWNAGRRHDFFVAIGVDQLIHAVILIFTVGLFFR
jgi:hypothetical protein